MRWGRGTGRYGTYNSELPEESSSSYAPDRQTEKGHTHRQIETYLSAARRKVARLANLRGRRLHCGGSLVRSGALLGLLPGELDLVDLRRRHAMHERMLDSCQVSTD